MRNTTKNIFSFSVVWSTWGLKFTFTLSGGILEIEFTKYHKKSLHDTLHTHTKLGLCYTQSSSPTVQTGRKAKTCDATGHKTTSTRKDNKKTVRNPGTGFQGWNSELIYALSLERPVERKWKGREEVWRKMSSLKDFLEAAESPCWQRRPLTGNKKSTTLNASEFLSNMVLKKFGAPGSVKHKSDLLSPSDLSTLCQIRWLPVGLCGPYNGSLLASYLGINEDERQQLLVETLFLIDSAYKD